MKKYILITFIFTTAIAFSQDTAKVKDAPKFSFLRAEESYSYLQNKEQKQFKTSTLDAIKFISFNKKRSIYATVGGEIRPRIESFTNRRWNDQDDEAFYSHRISTHTNFVFGKHIRVFGELFNGYTNHNKKVIQDDELKLHQGFVEVKFPMKKEQSFSFRFGRQELSLGSNRLVAPREGPNLRLSFDGARVIYKAGTVKLQAFYTKEVLPSFYTLDNEFALFNDKAKNPTFWGAYSQFKIKGMSGKNELYFLGFESGRSRVSDLSGKEKRYTAGLRRFGNLGKRLSFNTEIMYQFGTLGTANISAFNIGTDTDYKLINTKWTPILGMRLTWSSGDKNTGDNTLNTFNPMYVNPSFYGISANIIPINLFSIHPTLTLKPTKKITLFMDWGIFWRASKNDGLYTPSRFILRSENGVSDQLIGHQFGIKISYKVNRNLTFGLNSSYFIANAFLEKTGTSDNIFYIMPKISYKF